MQAIILAAGMGKRLKHLTENNTKCMINVNGKTLIERMLLQLDELNLKRVIIVVGYQSEALIKYIDTLNIKTSIIFVNNTFFYKTNNIYSLYLAKDYLIADDTILLESDLIFENKVLDLIIKDPRDTLALVDKYESWMDGTVVKLDADDTIHSFVPKSKFKFEDISEYYKTVNIYKFSKEFSNRYYAPFLDAYSKALGNNEYYEQVLRVIAMLDEPCIKALRLTGESWYEIDDIQDLDIAESVFSSDPSLKYECITKRYGGYWRYPKLLDFCYLVNPYFPPKKMLDEIKANFNNLVVSYPSGMNVIKLLASKNFNINQECVIVGNGAAEIIKIIMDNLSGTVGIIKPTFEEYFNRNSKNSIVFTPNSYDFHYTVDDIIEYFQDKSIQNLVLINPDNPSGNYLNRQNIIALLEWSKLQSIQIILDESFIDFTDEDNASFLNQEDLNKYPNLLVVKSISKSYGIPGLRLGIAASSNITFIKTLNNNSPIWNINSLAEFYLQIQGKYSAEYKKALIDFKVTRLNFASMLNSIPYLRVIPSQSNYFMCEVLPPYKAKQISAELLNKNILIKDLSGKIKACDKEYIRISIKADSENDKLIEKLGELR